MKTGAQASASCAAKELISHKKAQKVNDLAADESKFNLNPFVPFCGDKKPGVERNPRLDAGEARGARQPAKL